MVLLTVEVLEVVQSVMIMIPGTDHDTRIHLAVEVLETVKSWSNSMGDDPLEMMSSGDLRNCSEMEV